MLPRYLRWIFENSLSESVQTLRTWVLQESEFLTVAAETVHEVTGRTMDNRPVQKYTYRGHSTLFGNQIVSTGPEQIQCKVCGAQHDICNCEEILQMSIKDWWNIAKQFRLCFRCLGEGHSGKACPRSRQCGRNRCQESHH